ncbi:hypothetical protein N658DRAFT_364857 [Parathielavia hyrcaniae]|uniref:Uncharacterized protein n=1 Tax=Parathielavia hyrcaniae TaxID=113614 RepID=A0AAN6PQZ4_9PEZI|nr:hypothetical protein N658DRAFT_364857 [Parathielavia hyrcaniae]
MDIPVSLIGNGPISLPLKHEAPIHIHITIPYSLLVKDFDPNTTPVPVLERPRCWLITRLFERRRETPSDAPDKACLIAWPVFHRVWPKLSTLLIGKEEPSLYSHVGCDAKT